jgi:hypothetical protein
LHRDQYIITYVLVSYNQDWKLELTKSNHQSNQKWLKYWTMIPGSEGIWSFPSPSGRTDQAVPFVSNQKKWQELCPSWRKKNEFRSHKSQGDYSLFDTGKVFHSFLGFGKKFVPYLTPSWTLVPYTTLRLIIIRCVS